MQEWPREHPPGDEQQGCCCCRAFRSPSRLPRPCTVSCSPTSCSLASLYSRLPPPPPPTAPPVRFSAPLLPCLRLRTWLSCPPADRIACVQLPLRPPRLPRVVAVPLLPVQPSSCSCCLPVLHPPRATDWRPCGCCAAAAATAQQAGAAAAAAAGALHSPFSSLPAACSARLAPDLSDVLPAAAASGYGGSAAAAAAAAGVCPSHPPTSASAPCCLLLWPARIRA